MACLSYVMIESQVLPAVLRWLADDAHTISMAHTQGYKEQTFELLEAYADDSWLLPSNGSAAQDQCTRLL